ncbi:3D domain-containing protein [Paenibacillus sp. MBLB4367]|uniref:3D domain-containing protein n=1 Tax=Paenibacillus sp. MBLB4367 TaxID=3384767 RepID=UPI0039082280
MTFNPVKKTLAGLAISLSIAAFALPAHAMEVAEDTYAVQENDTFWSVSQKLHIPLMDLLAANKTIDPMNVYKGLTFNLPPMLEKTVFAYKAESDQAPAVAVQAAPAAEPAQAEPAPTTAAATPAPTPAAKKVAAAPVKAEAKATPVKAKPVAAANTVNTANGKTVSYSKMIPVVATAYSDAAEENGGWGAVDYFGNPLKVGTIAVDPNVIPMGSKLYVTGYTFNGLPTGMIATASDQGGAIKGNRIDIFIPNSMGNVQSFGMQNVKVYVLK